MEESCCTCATVLSDSRRRRRLQHGRIATDPAGDSSDGPEICDEKELLEKDYDVPDRRLECCARVICGNCLDQNVRFATYCPYCQVSTAGHDPSIPSAGLKGPPSYGSATPAATHTTAAAAAAPPQQQQQQQRPLTPPPPYTEKKEEQPPADDGDDEKAALHQQHHSQQHHNHHHQPEAPPTPPGEDVLHFLDHARDTVTSLSLRYNIPAAALRRANRLGSDHLLLGRRVVVIPASPLPAAAAAAPLESLSPRPVEGEDEERRKNRVRRWMVACREADYDVAVLYLEQAGYDVDAAVDAYFADEAWERANPLQKGTSKRKSVLPSSSSEAAAAAAAATGASQSSSSSSSSSAAGRLGFGARTPGEGGWTWAAQAPFLRRSHKKDHSGPKS